MKNKVIFLFVLVMFSCSKDDSASETYYSATIEEVECRGDRTQVCISKQQYEDLIDYKKSYTYPEPCMWISLRDVNNKPYSGYLRSLGKGNNKPESCE